MKYIQNLNETKWQFKNIPEFTQGKLSPVFADCGTGMEIDCELNSENDSFTHTFYEVNAEDIISYCNTLTKAGFEKLYENRIADNMYFQFKVQEGLFYISYLQKSNVARFILDRCRTKSISDFGYSDFTPVNEDTVFSQYSLHYAEMIKGTTCDCGMNYVFRLRDNSLIIIDGGEVEQATDIAIKDYMDFLHKLTETQNGEKIRISLWLCTHAHNDHMDFLSKLMRFFNGELEIERAAFNFANSENVKPSVDVDVMKERFKKYYPDTEYIKLHAGNRFNIANAKITVLCVNEDVIDKDKERVFAGCNTTSCIFTVETEKIKTLFLADADETNGGVLIENFPAEITDCEFMQAAHHGINKNYEVYETLNAKYILLPQCRMNMETRFEEIFEHLHNRYGENNILLANDKTEIFTLKDGAYSRSSREHVGCAYDNSEW